MKYQGKQIVLSGKPGQKGIIPFQRTEEDGTTVTIGLQINKVYEVGGLDENGVVIEDWVYERYLTNDMNNNRMKSRAEERSDKNRIVDGVVNNQVGFAN